jgi:hypothetical protein
MARCCVNYCEARAAQQKVATRRRGVSRRDQRYQWHFRGIRDGFGGPTTIFDFLTSSLVETRLRERHRATISVVVGVRVVFLAVKRVGGHAARAIALAQEINVLLS